MPVPIIFPGQLIENFTRLLGVGTILPLAFLIATLITATSQPSDFRILQSISNILVQEPRGFYNIFCNDFSFILSLVIKVFN